MSDFGNDLYTGRRGVDYVGRRKLWFTISAIFLAISIAVLAVKGLNLGLEFRGGSEFRVDNVTSTQDYETRAKDVVESAAAAAKENAGNINVTQLGDHKLRIQTEKLSEATTAKVSDGLQKTFKVSQGDISSTFIGASWGASVTKQALNALLIFLLVVSLVLAAYFRTWTMALASVIAMLHDILITVGIYTLVGFEISPATMIGFLTILAYSLYDTVVVFDKVKENVRTAEHTGRQSFSQAANLAVNQTLVRSINTTMMSILPVSVVLLAGLLFIGPGVLLDLALVLLVGITVGAYSSVFIATPALAMLREREPAMKKLAERAARYQKSHGGANFSGVLTRDLASHGTHSTTMDDADDDARTAGAAPGGATSARALAEQGRPQAEPPARRPLHPSVQQAGPRNQPKKAPRSKR